MEDLTDSFKDMHLKKALFNETVDLDEEETLGISTWKTGLSIRRSLSSGDGTIKIRRSLSCGDVCDEDFYSPEVGMAMILGDRPQEVQAGNMTENVTSCSSWAINSSPKPFEGLAQTVINQRCRELFVNFNDITEFSVVNCSTPKTEQPFLFPKTPALSMAKDTILKASAENHHQACFSRRDSSLWPMLFHGAANALDVPTIFGTRKKQNTRTLEAGEITKDPFQAYNGSTQNKQNSRTLEAEEIAKDPFQTCSGSTGNRYFQSFDCHTYDDTTLRNSVKNNARSLCQKEQLWIVQPQALTLDASGKGRLLLINKSSNRNLKFKIVFDGKLINVCPQSGNLRSKSEIGLRVIVSRCLKDNSNEVTEDIRITCGNIEKRVPITICKRQKEKSKRDRSYRCF